MKLKQKLTITGVSVVLSLSAINVKLASSQQVPPCNQVSNPSPGTRCYQRVTVEARHVDYGSSSVGDASSTSTDGWVVTSWQGPTSTSNNNGSANLNFVQRGSDFQFSDILNQYDKDLIDLRDKLQSYASFPVSGVPITVGGMVEKINYSLQENQHRRDVFSSARTNVDKVTIHAEASGRCVRRVLGACVDSVGGWYQGYVDVYMVYVGKQTQVQADNQAVVQQAQNLFNLIQQQANSNSGCPNITGAFQRPTDSLMIYWEQNGCNISSNQPSKDFSHTITGKWRGDYFDYQVSRRNIHNGCTTLMYGKLYKINNSQLRTVVYGSDGKCDLSTNFTEDSVWLRR